MRFKIGLASAATVALLAACSDDQSGAAAPAQAAARAEAAPAAVGAAPAPRPGLWEHVISGGSLPQPTTVRVCVGSTPAGANPFNAPQPGVTCSENTASPAPGGAAFHSVCESQGMTVVSDGQVSGDLNTAYQVRIASRASGVNVPQEMTTTTTAIDAKRLGDCPAGVSPDTVVD